MVIQTNQFSALVDLVSFTAENCSAGHRVDSIDGVTCRACEGGSRKRGVY